MFAASAGVSSIAYPKTGKALRAHFLAAAMLAVTLQGQGRLET
jgi:hypothetical protein